MARPAPDDRDRNRGGDYSPSEDEVHIHSTPDILWISSPPSSRSLIPCVAHHRIALMRGRGGSPRRTSRRVEEEASHRTTVTLATAERQLLVLLRVVKARCWCLDEIDCMMAKVSVPTGRGSVLRSPGVDPSGRPYLADIVSAMFFFVQRRVDCKDLP